MKFTIEQYGEIVEEFEAAGHRDTKKSTYLDALKVAAAWGYHKYDGYYTLSAEDGTQIAIVDPYKSAKWKKVMHKDYLHIVRVS